MNNKKYIQSCVSAGELLAGLAEEATELAHAALKYRRAMTGDNPTPVSVRDARKALLEELADINLYLSMMPPFEDVDLAYMAVVDQEKTDRWADRLRKKEREDAVSDKP